MFFFGLTRRRESVKTSGGIFYVPLYHLIDFNIAFFLNWPNKNEFIFFLFSFGRSIFFTILKAISKNAAQPSEDRIYLKG
jgi:hypothetical protein